MHKSLRSSSLTHSEPKEQGHNTPRELVPAICGALGGPPDVDPCSNAGSVIPARTRIFLPENVPVGDGSSPDYATVIGDGLAQRWHLFGWGRRLTVFCNPPWEDLGRWLTRLEAAARAGAEVLALIPLRSHRVYWPPVWRANAICFLKAIGFEGHDNKIATPCVMVYWGPAVQRFRKHFTPWGHVLTLNRGRPRVERMPLPNVADVIPDSPRMKLLAELLKRATPEQLLDAVTEGLSGLTFGEIWNLIDDVQSEFGEEAAGPLQRMIESMPMQLSAAPTGVRRTAKKASKRKPPAKKAAPKKKTAPKSAPAKDEAPSADNGKAESPNTTEALDKAVQERFLQGNKEPIKTQDVADALDVSRATALRSLQRHADAGRAKLEGAGRAATYRSLMA